ncbi:hypothetical protein DRN62_02495 [Nanoarchaeota archaeon]|nr:MAG: hypothetical protein DRN62_02495 [Nanoarchaeota archaeon]
MQCEICGKEGKLLKVRIEGVLLSVCEDCAKFGEVVREKKKRKEEKVLEMNPELPKILRRLRGKKKQEEFAREVNIPVSLLRKWELGDLVMDIKNAKKLEKRFGIKALVEKEIPCVKVKGKMKEKLTLGDVVELKE